MCPFYKFFSKNHLTNIVGRAIIYLSLMEQGQPIAFDEGKALEILAERDIIIHITLHDGTEEAIAWGCDLGHEYIRINGEYRLRT